MGLALALLVISLVVPPMVTGKARPLSTNFSLSISTELAEGYVFRSSSLLSDRVPKSNAKNANCQDDDNPLWCYIEEGWVSYNAEANTSPAEKDSVAMSDTFQSFTFNSDAICQVTQHISLNRESTFPVPELDSSLVLTVPRREKSFQAPVDSRTGVEFYFPPTTEQRSYDFYDPFIGKSVPIDFKEKTKIDGKPVYVFEHEILGEKLSPALEETARISAQELADKGSDGLMRMQLSGPASDFYTDQELKELKLSADTQLVMSPFYSMRRTVFVEPNTGIVVDKKERGGTFYARNAKDAKNPQNVIPSRERALYQGTFQWDAKTTKAAFDLANPTIMMLRAANIFSWVMKLSALALLAYGFYIHTRAGKAEELEEAA